MRRILLLALVCAPAGSALGWVQSTARETSVCLGWDGRTIVWSPAHPMGGAIPEVETLDVIRRSFDVWQAPACSDLRFSEGRAGAREVGFDAKGGNRSVVLVRDRSCASLVPSGDPCYERFDCASAYDCWEYDKGIIAMTTVTSSNCSGEILDADVELNASGFRFTNEDGPPCESADERGCVAMDLQNTMVHEIGHLIGLDHSVRADAAMYRSAAPGETSKRRLSDDDVEALCTIYPAGGERRRCGSEVDPRDCKIGRQRQGANSFDCSAAGGSAVEGLIAAGLLGSFLAWRRRR